MSERVPLTDPSPTTAPMTHREILNALSGLLLAMFVAMLSSTVVANALPRMVAELGGSQSGYSWVVVATLLTMTATTPVWGKLADLYDKKVLVQIALTIFTLGSMIAAFATSMPMLIAARAVQGLGTGGLMALVQVVIAVMVSPRERGRYSGYIGAVFAIATVSGPLIGGVLVDTPGLGWRSCFWVGVPLAVFAFIVLQRTLDLPTVRRDVSLDLLGATLIMTGVSVLLVWITLAGNQFAWASWTSGTMIVAGLLLLIIATIVEVRHAADPIIPIRLFGDRTTALATVASIFIGVAMFGATVYLSQYFQIARGMSPTKAGLMSIAMVGGLLVSSITTGRIISNTGVWKRYLVGGMVLVVTGMALLATIDAHTGLWWIGAFMACLGVGVGATQQNLVVAVQNNTALADMGAASSVIAFFRSLGGSAGVAALGALLSARVVTEVTTGMARLGIPVSGAESHQIPDLRTLPAPVREVFQDAFGVATGSIFAAAVPLAVVALVAILFIKEVPLRTSIDMAATATAATPSAAPEHSASVAAESTPRDPAGVVAAPGDRDE